MKYITPVRPSAAHGLVAEVYKQIKSDFGAVVAPFAVHSVSPRLLAGAWAAFRESQLVGIVPREIKEAIAVGVSKSNQCPFCVDAHVIMLHALRAHSTAHALTNDQLDQLSERIQRVSAWARATGRAESNGGPLPVPAAEAPEMIGTAVFFHYINRICPLLLDDTPLPSSRPWLKPFLSRSAGWYFSFAARRPKTPGDSLVFLPDVCLPEDMAWASASATLAGAWARFAQEVEQQGQSALAAETRKLVSDYIQNWEGGALGTSRGAVEHAIQQLSPEHRGSGRLVLLTALAPHEVDEKIICEFADPGQDQEKLLGRAVLGKLYGGSAHRIVVAIGQIIAGGLELEAPDCRPPNAALPNAFRGAATDLGIGTIRLHRDAPSIRAPLIAHNRKHRTMRCFPQYANVMLAPLQKGFHERPFRTELSVLDPISCRVGRSSGVRPAGSATPRGHPFANGSIWLERR